MILLDSSALLCGFLREPEWNVLKDVLNSAGKFAVGAPTLLECGIVLESKGLDGRAVMDSFLLATQGKVIPFSEDHFRAALQAASRFGKSKHPARLNFGDCISYAYARLTGLPLVYKGQDFGKTDLKNLIRLDS